MTNAFVDDLSIPKMRPRFVAPSPSGAPTYKGLMRTFSLPEFWKGCAKARSELSAGSGLASFVIADLQAGVKLSDSTAFKAWATPVGAAR